MNSLYSLGVRQTSSLHADLESMAQMSTPSSSIQGTHAALIRLAVTDGRALDAFRLRSARSFARSLLSNNR